MIEKEKAPTYRDLVVWQKAIDLVVAVYEMTKAFPTEEIYGLTAQIRRSAISIASNIAEGKMRWTDGEFIRFLRVAYASGAELETQLEITKRVIHGNIKDGKVYLLLNEVMRMLNAILNKKSNASKR